MLSDHKAEQESQTENAQEFYQNYQRQKFLDILSLKKNFKLKPLMHEHAYHRYNRSSNRLNVSHISQEKSPSNTDESMKNIQTPVKHQLKQQSLTPSHYTNQKILI